MPGGENFSCLFTVLLPGVASGEHRVNFLLFSCWGKIVRCKEESAERLDTTNLIYLVLLQYNYTCTSLVEQ